MEITLASKNVHNKQLATIIEGHLQAIVAIINIAIDTASVVELVDIMLHGIAEDYKLEQINVIGDLRNNKFKDMQNGKYIIDVYYRHKNCFNTTHLSFTFKPTSKLGR